jgi:hypothetical protein
VVPLSKPLKAIYHSLAIAILALIALNLFANLWEVHSGVTSRENRERLETKRTNRLTGD